MRSQALAPAPGVVEQGSLAMSHSGSPPNSEDHSPGDCTGYAAADRCSLEVQSPSHAAWETIPAPFDTAVTPVQAARADAMTARDSLPFVVQAGHVLFMVAEAPSGWIVAELSFDSSACMFVETRRSEFQWPREAFGRLLSRAMIGAADEDEAERVTREFSKWVAAQFVAHGTA
jgi:hypothetical protein